ncbi:hypothetical protein M0805_001520 [Coniferiporia weirii]|nr:hypothetical protein M0805_001520 [Coniferiporia weirii]
MTKSVKRKKEKVSDFTKPKLKLGKGKQLATNAVDTTFKARSIALPQQSIAATKDSSTPTTKRKLSFDDLLAHLKHYNAGVRKDALQGLRELLEEYHALIEPNLLKLVNACVRMISDEDASVRKALHSFLAWLLSRIPREQISPHASTLLLFTASAQTHIFPEIRIDAIRILDLLLEFIPDQVVSGFLDAGPGVGQGSHGRKILDGYLGLLNVGARFSEDESKGIGSSSGALGQPTTLITLSSASKAVVLRSFSKFILHATGQEGMAKTSSNHTTDNRIPLWYLSPSFCSSKAFNSYAEVLSTNRSSRTSQRRSCVWSRNDPEGDDFIGDFPLSNIADSIGTTGCLLDLERVIADIDQLVNADKTSDDADSSSARLTASLCRTVHPVLISTFLDCAPTVFSPSETSPEAELELVLAILEISRCLYGRLLRDGNATEDQKRVAQEELKALVGHMMVYFPFGENRMVVQDMKSEAMFQQMNLIYCELFSLRSLATAHEDKHREGMDGPIAKRRKLVHSGSKKLKASAASPSNQVARIQEYVIHCLNGSTAPSANGGTYPLGQALTMQAYVALLPTLWWLLDCPANEDGDPLEVLDAILQHAIKAGSASGVKMVATEFVARLVLLQSEPSYRGTFRVGRNSSEGIQTSIQDWFLHLPKVLWELGDKHIAASELILLFFLRLSQRRSWLNGGAVRTALCTRLRPFFTMQHATRGELRGPFAKLNKTSADLKTPDLKNEEQHPAPLKRLALDVAATLASAKSGAPSNLPPRALAGRRVREPGAGIRGGAAACTQESLEAEKESRDGLRRAVEKAVSGMAEEAYWCGVSCR